MYWLYLTIDNSEFPDFGTYDITDVEPSILHGEDNNIVCENTVWGGFVKNTPMNTVRYGFMWPSCGIPPR